MTHPLSPRQLAQLMLLSLIVPVSATGLLGALQYYSWGGKAAAKAQFNPFDGAEAADTKSIDTIANRLNGRPQLSPQPNPQETWQCEVVVVGGSLGGISAAAQSMHSGAKTCLIELTPWLGGQISAQGVSALDESMSMRAKQNFSKTWYDFRQLIESQTVTLPSWTNLALPQPVKNINSCWVGTLCFPPEAGASAAEQLLQQAVQSAPGSRWETSTAFKGAEFDQTGRQITAIYAVHRVPRSANYRPLGRLSQELPQWYSWSSDKVFEKVPIRLEPPPGKRMIVIDATDTGELVGWAGIPYRLGSEAKATTGEANAAQLNNPDCTQAFTFPFVMALYDDKGASKAALEQIQPELPRSEHWQSYDLEGFPMFNGGSLFHYRRIVSTTQGDPHIGAPSIGDMSMINWNRGNDWIWMDPPLILNEEKIATSGQHQNWMGGLSIVALRYAEEHALLFADWLIQTQSRPNYPLTFVSGIDSPMGTQSGLSMYPYIREGRRILGRPAYGQKEFMMQESDLRQDMPGWRDFSPTAVALTHYGIDMHGCLYRSRANSGEASSAPVEDESMIRPIQIPIESLIPQGVDNLLIGGKAIAVTHIANASTRIHYGEWVIGGAAGGIAGWLITQNQPKLMLPDLASKKLVPYVQEHLQNLGMRLSW